MQSSNIIPFFICKLIVKHNADTIIWGIFYIREATLLRFDELAPHGVEMLLDFETTNTSFDIWLKEKYMVWSQYTIWDFFVPRVYEVWFGIKKIRILAISILASSIHILLDQQIEH